MRSKVTTWGTVGAGLFVAALGVRLMGAAAVWPDEQEVRVVGPAGLPGLPGVPGGAAPMPLGGGIIVGQAVDAGSKRAVPGALITLGLPGVAPLRALADGEGRFAFRDLPKGSFTIVATKAGYVDGASGRLRPAGPSQPVILTDGDRMLDVSIPMWRFAAIAGTVVDESSEPVVGVTVRIYKRTITAGRRKLVAGATDTTDDRGAYRIGSLEPGEYVVAIPMTQSAWPTSLDTFMMAGGETPRDLMLSTAGSLSLGAGGGFQVGAGGAPGAIVLQTDRAMPPAGSAEDGSLLAYPTIYYSGAATASRATGIAVASGEERVGVDMQLRPVRTSKVSGIVNGPDGPAANLSLSLIPADAEDLVLPIETATTVSDAGGEFTFAGVPAGQYTLRVIKTPRGGAGLPVNVQTTIVQSGGSVMAMAFRNEVVGGAGPASPPLPTEPTLWAEQPVAVSTAEVRGLTVTMRSGARVNGTVEFNGAAERPKPDQLTVIALTLEPADGRTAGGVQNVRGRIEPGGQFKTMGVPPGRYLLKVSGAPTGWAFRGAMQGGRDVSDQPIDIEGSDVGGIVLTFTDKPTQVSGTVTGSSGSSDAGSTVLVFPTDSEGWSNYGSTPRRIREARAGKDGSFSIQNLPPGEYYIAAISEAGASDWQDPKFLESLSREASRLRLGEGASITQALRTIR